MSSDLFFNYKETDVVVSHIMYTLTLDGCGGCYGFIALGRDDNYLPEADNTYRKLRNACWQKNASVYLCTISLHVN